MLNKKYILFLILFSAIGLESFAQWSVGVIGFPQISNLTSKSIRKDAVMQNKLTIAGGGGLTVTKDFSDQLGLQLGVLYSAQNQTINSNYTIGGEPHTWKSGKHFDYLKIPLLLRISEQVSEKMRFVIFAGPQFSYLLKYNGGMVVYIEDSYFDLPNTPKGNNYFNKYTVDAVGGIGLEFPISPAVDFVSALKVDMNMTNAQNKDAEYSGYKVSDINGGTTARNVTYALVLGLNYHFANSSSLIAPSNKFRNKSLGKKNRY